MHRVICSDNHISIINNLFCNYFTLFGQFEKSKLHNFIKIKEMLLFLFKDFCFHIPESKYVGLKFFLVIVYKFGSFLHSWMGLSLLFISHILIWNRNRVIISDIIEKLDLDHILESISESFLVILVNYIKNTKPDCVQIFYFWKPLAKRCNNKISLWC